MSTESSLKTIKMWYKNWSEGYLDSAYQKIALMRQFYPQSKIEKIDPETGKVKVMKRSIRLDGIELNKEGDELVERKINDYSFFELKDEYFDLAGDVDINIDVDTILPISKGLKMQKIEQAFAQLMPILTNPNIDINRPGVTQLIREFIESHGLSDKISEQLQAESNTDDLDKAIQQEIQIVKGQWVEGCPGEANIHLWHHAQTIMELMMNIQNADPTKITAQQSMDMMKARDYLVQHLKIDSTPRQDQVKATVAYASPQPPMPQGQPQGMPPMPAGQMPMAGAPGVQTADLLGGNEMGLMQPTGGMPMTGIPQGGLM